MSVISVFHILIEKIFLKTLHLDFDKKIKEGLLIEVVLFEEWLGS